MDHAEHRPSYPVTTQAGGAPAVHSVPIEALPVPACVIDGNGRILAHNYALARRLGRDASEMSGRAASSLADPDQAWSVEAGLRSALGSGGEPVVLRDVVIPARSGPAMTADIHITVIPGSDDRTLLLAFREQQPEPGQTSLDHRSRQLLAAHLQRTPLAVIEWAVDRSVRFWNPAAERIFGYRHEQLANVDAFPLLVDDASRAHVDRIWEQLLTRTGGETSINTNKTRKGQIIQCRWHNTSLIDESGAVVGIASLVEDITESVRAERALKDARSRLERVVINLPVMVWALDDNGAPVLWNETAERLTGYRAADIIGNPEATRLLGLNPKDSDYDSVERSLRCHDGSIRRIQWSNIAARCPIPDWCAWGVGIDVTDRHAALEAYHASERRFRDIIESVELAGVVVDKASRIRFVNEFFLRLTGWNESDVLDRPWSEILGAAASAAIPSGVVGPEPFALRTEGELPNADGVARTIVWTRSLLREPDGSISGACALGMDVTDLRRAEAELAAHRDRLEELVDDRSRRLAESERRLRDAERLSAMGRIAAGLSHDLGNVLLPIRCHLDTLASAPLDDRRRDAVTAVRRGVELLEHLGEGLEVLGGSADGEAVAPRSPETVLPDIWWDEVNALLRGVVPERVGFRAEIEPGLPRIVVPSHRLTRAVMNLLVNAVEAIDAAGGSGHAITLALGLDDDSDEVEITVRDTGKGIPEHLIRRVAEPFFTTKKRTISTGLGLSIVNAVANTAGGRFGIGSHPSGGTIAVLRLPAVHPAATDNTTAVAVQIDDSRMGALCAHVVKMLGCHLAPASEADYILISDPEKFEEPPDGASEKGRNPVHVIVEPGAGLTGITDRLRRAITRGKGTS